MLENLKYHLTYQLQDQSHTLSFAKNITCDALKTVIHHHISDSHEKLTLSIFPEQEIEIIDLYATMDYTFGKDDRIFVNGYQSWTDSKEFSINEKLRGLSRLAKPLMNKYQFDKYGDYTFVTYPQRPGEFHGFTYSYIRQNRHFKLIGSLTEANGYTIIEENSNKNTITLRKDCRGLFINQAYIPFQLVWVEGSEDAVFDTYFDLMSLKKPQAKPMTGWTSWYHYYQDINEAIIVENAKQMQLLHKKIDIFQIDDGYQTAVGDWLSIDPQKFPNGMKVLSDTIKACGYRSGIWLAPFVCETKSEIFRKNPHWVLRNDMGQPLSAGSNWSGFYVLDLNHIEVKDYLAEVFHTVLKEWGYDLVKLDFLYAACLYPTKYKTRGQLMTEAMDFLRKCVDDKLMLGCGVPLGPAFGRVDYCRIGCDVGLDWDDKRYMKLFHRERVSTLNAIQNTIGRRQLNRRAFINDPDVFFLRKNNIQLTQPQKETLALVNRLFGDLIFTSDAVKDYDDTQHKQFDDMMKLTHRHIEKVEAVKQGLLEITYLEEGKQYLALVNLSHSSIPYSQGNGKTVLQPFESQVLSAKDHK